MTKEELDKLKALVDRMKSMTNAFINGEQAVLDKAIKALDQEPCDDCISKQAAIDLADELKDNLPDDDHLSDMVMAHNEGILEYQTQLSLLPSIQPKQGMGRWILVQRGKYVDVNCSECGFSRIKEFAYNYTVEDISEQEFRDFVEKNKMNFCECCGTKME